MADPGRGGHADAMRRRTALTAPGATRSQWHDPAQFFHKGTSGQWHELLGPEDLARYASRAHSLAPADLVTWVHRDRLD